MLTPIIGTVSHGTLRTECLIPTLVHELERLTEGSGRYLDLIAEALEYVPAAYSDEEANELCELLYEALNDLAPEGCYFGAHPSDGSDFGFWPQE